MATAPRIYRSAARTTREVSRARRILGRTIRSLRKKRKLTQEQAAEKARLEVKHWQYLEAARTSNPTLATLLAVATALDVRLAELVDGV